ncbi:MAG: alpha/beta hydrolase [Defluviitaleaceae bacterium]|nr:alpha/beta hydrolase [Defluviitaleaceae bacterium]
MKFQPWLESMTEQAYKDAKYIETKIGKVHYTDAGKGSIILHSHGSPAGADVGLLFFDDYAKDKFRIITPSRPGFLGTSLDLGTSIEAQADFFKHFLDSLGIKEVFIHAWSGGGPPAIKFAIKYPKYTKGLILFCAVSHKWVHKITIFEKMILNDRGIWLFWNLSKIFRENFRQKIAKELGVDYDYVKKDSKRLFLLDKFFEMTAPPSLRNEGSFNDIKMYSEMGNFDFGEIKVPTLALFSLSDNQLPISNGDIPAKEISQNLVDYFRFTHGGHMPMIDKESCIINERIFDFILRYSSGE